jgi:hypothetical protein
MIVQSVEHNFKWIEENFGGFRLATLVTVSSRVKKQKKLVLRLSRPDRII